MGASQGGQHVDQYLFPLLVPVHAGDDEHALAGRILQGVEHVIYPRALRWAAEGRLHVVREGPRARVVIDGDAERFVFATG